MKVISITFDTTFIRIGGIKMKNTLTNIAIILVITLVVTLASYALLSKRKDSKSIEQKVEETVTENTAPLTIDKDITQQDVDTEDIIEDMHKMANTITIATEEIGQITITRDMVEELIVRTQKCNNSKKAQLLAILTRWEQGDFSHAIDDHNYVWSLLEGDVGKAHSIDEVQVEAATKQMKMTRID